MDAKEQGVSNMTPEALDDHALAKTLAEAAGRILCTVRDTRLLSGKALGDAGDMTANTFLIHAIKAARPDDGILSEESADNAKRLGKSRVWIIDPLDGTREYAEGRKDWAVHVGLSINGVASIGAVALPDLDATYVTGNGGVLAPTNRPVKLAVSRTRPASSAKRVADALGATLVPMGSAGFKAMAVVRGEVDAYVHNGGQYQWDNCAPVAVAKAFGLHCCRLNGDPMVYNLADTFMPDLIICRPELATDIIAAANAGG